MDSSNQGQKLLIPEEIRGYLDSLLKDAGMTSLDAEMHEEMIKELYVRLDNFITTTIIDKLPPEHLEEFVKMNEDLKPQSEIEQYLKENMPNSQDVLSQAFIDFRDLYLGKTSVAREAESLRPDQSSN